MFEQLYFGSSCSIIHLCFSLCVHPTYTGSINGVGSSTSISLAEFSTWVRGSALPKHFDVVHVDRQEQPELSMHVRTFPCWYVLPFVLEVHFLGISLPKKACHWVNVQIPSKRNRWIVPTFWSWTWRNPDPFFWTTCFW